MGSMKGKQAKIDAAFGRIADMIPSGNLLASTDPVGFLDAIATELKELRAVLHGEGVNLRESMNTCTWAEDADGNWRTKCRNIHIFIDGTPAQNEYEFCPYCGAKIETVIYNDHANADGSAVADTVRRDVGD